MIIPPADLHRTMPHDADAEKGVLASILLHPAAVFPHCHAAGMSREAFYIPAHGTLWETFHGLHNECSPVDFVTVCARLRTQGALEKCGGPGFINDLITFLPTAAMVAHYLAIVAEHHLVRRALDLTWRLSASLHIREDAPAAILAVAQAEILGLITGQAKARKSTKEIIREVLEEIVSGRDDAALMRTGIEPVDSELRLSRSDYIVLPGPTSSGKSALSAQLCISLAKQGFRVLYFPLEMSARQVVKRALGAESGYNAEQVRALATRSRDLYGQTREEHEIKRATDAFAGAAQTIAALDFTLIEDVSDLDGILATARAHAAVKPLDVLCVDYPALMRVTGNFERKQLALAHAANSFKRFAGEINGLVITPSQVNKEGGTREAADFEHAANAILAVGFADGDQGERTVTITKQRDGARGQKLRLEWEGMTTRFKPIPKDERQ